MLDFVIRIGLTFETDLSAIELDTVNVTGVNVTLTVFRSRLLYQIESLSVNL